MSSGKKSNVSSISPVKITDNSGNQAKLIEDADSTYHLAVTTNQKVNIDPNNSSTTNLDAGNSYTFTGTSTSTLGVVGLQVSLKTDQNATVYIDQSPDGTNWDISDSFDYYYSKGGNGWTIQAVNSYVRVRVILTGTTATTYFRLQLALAPIVEAVPRSLSHSGRMKTETQIEDSQIDRYVGVTPLGEMKTIEPVRLVGTGFEGTTKNANFWTETPAPFGSGTVTQTGQIILKTGTTANSTAAYTSVRRARKIPGTTMQFRSAVRFVTAGTANNKRAIGPYDANEGFFFQLNGSTFSVVARTGASDANIVSSGSFNGNLGEDYVMDTNIHRLTIIYSEISAEFYVDGKLLHKMFILTAPLTTTLTLPVRMENINSGGITTDVEYHIRFACILRFGKYKSANIYKYVAPGTTAVLKYGAGHLDKVINTNNAGTFTVYDAVAATPGTEIMVIDTSKVLGSIDFDVDYSVGLTVVSAGATCTVIYE